MKFKSVLTQGYSSSISWIPALFTIYVIVCLIICKYYFSGTLLALIFIVTIIFVIHDDNLRRSELYRKVDQILMELTNATILCKGWTLNNYPHLCCPLSPCVALQWTYRDGKIVNLPWALLVRGDYIVMRPGQVAPGLCTEIHNKRNFRCGETYGLPNPVEPPKRPIARSPLSDMICIMEATPYLETLKTSLDLFLKRPATIYNQQRHLVGFKFVFC